MKTALEQAYLEREQLLSEVEGASESSRTALSAISGQELRKAERETAKIERDKEIAGQRVDAIIEQGTAKAAIDLEQTKATIALQNENRRKNEAVAMIKLGVYDPSFAGVLGMQDNVIKKVAENKAREIEAAKARARAAAQAKAEYEAALADQENRKYTKSPEKYKDLPAEDKAAIEKIVQENGNSADYTNVEKRVDFQMTASSIAPAGRIANSTKTAEKADIMQKQGRAYARELIAESIYKKRGSDLTSLENSYKNSFNFKLEEAMDGMFNATTQAEYNSAQTLFKESVKIANERNAEILEVISDAYKKGVNLSAEDLYKVKAQREDLNSLRLALTSMMKREGVSDETKGIINEMTVEIDDVIFTLDAAEKYSREYDPESEEIRFRQLDYKYGDRVDELLAKEVPNSVKAKSDNVWERVVASVTPEPAADHNKTLTEEEWEYLQLRRAVKTKEKKDLLEKEFGGFTTAELGYISADDISLNADGGPWADFVPSKEAESARKRYAGMKKSGSISDAAMLTYISERNKAETQNDKDAFFDSIFDNAPGKTNAEKYRFIQGVIESASDPTKNIWSDEEWEFYNNYLAKAAGKKYGITTMTDVKNNQYSSMIGYAINNDGLQELERDMKEYYGRISTSGIVEKYSDSKIDANVSKEFIENAINGFDYVLGSGPYSGWFFDFESDLKRFAEGDYGYFRVDEGERILTVLKKEGANAAFDYYAAVREGALERQAEDWFGDAAWIPGLFSGLIKFTTDGHFMLWNALSGSNKTISGDVFSAAHQIAMEDFAESDSGWNQFGELAYMAGYSIVDMAPAVALSYVPYAGPYLSSAYIYAKSLGTTYTDAIKQGKTTSEAMTFATMTAASEVLMEKAIGGITKLGGSGSLTNKLTSVIENLAVRQGVKTAMNLAVKMGAEGFEEFLQEVLSPFYATVADALNGTDEIESNEVDWEAAFQSFAIGALTGGAFGVVDIRTENNARADYLSHVAIERGDAIKIINKAAELGNKRAKRVLDAIENNSPLRKGKEGLYQYVSDHDITNMRKSIRNRSKRKIVQGIEHELAQIEGRDHSKDGEIVQVFRDLLGNRSVDVAQIALLLNDPAALEILNRMLGEDVGALMPHEALALARLAAFVGTDGKVDKARIEAFRDAYGRLDYKAIAEMQRFEEMEERAILKAMEGDDRYRVVFQKESDYSKVKEGSNESLEELKRLSEASGVIFYVSDQYKTGTYLATNVMAIKPDDISKAAYYTMGKKAYYMTLRLDPEKAAVIKGFLLAEIEKMIGADGIIAEKEKLRQQGVDEEMLEDELCARMMPAVFLRGNYKAAEELAASDSEAAEKMRLVLDSIRRYINGNINTQNEAVLAKKEISPVDFEMNDLIAPFFEELSKEDPNHKGGCEKIIKKMAKDLGITGRRYSTPELDFDFSFGQKGLAESLHNQNYYGGDYVDFAKVIANLEKVLDNATLIEEHSDKYSGKIKEDTELLRVYVMMSLLQDGNTVIPVQLEIKRRIDGKSVLYVAVAAKKIEVDVAGKNGSQAVGNGETLLSTSKYSISEIFKKINTSDERFLKYVPDFFLSANQSVAKNNALDKSESDVDKLENKKHYENRGVNKELMELYDRLNEAVLNHYIEKNSIDVDSGEMIESISDDGRAFGKSKLAAEYESYRHINDNSKAIGTSENYEATDAMKEAGITVIEGSVGKNESVSGDAVEMAKKAKKQDYLIGKFKREKKPTVQESRFASGVAIGDWTLDKIPDNLRPDIVRELSELIAKRREYQGISPQVANRAAIQADLDAEAAEDAKMLEQANFARRILLQNSYFKLTETPKRILQAYFGYENGNKIYYKYFAPVVSNNAYKTRFLNEHREKLREFPDENGKMGRLNKKERPIAQQMIEAKTYFDVIKRSPKMEKVIDWILKEYPNAEELLNNSDLILELDQMITAGLKRYGLGFEMNKNRDEATAALRAKILHDRCTVALENESGVNKARVTAAADAYATEYAALYDAVYDFLIAHGMDPIGEIARYTPHMQIEGGFAKFFEGLRGMLKEGEIADLPINMVGMTGNLKPNKKWDPHFEKRTGDTTDYDIYYTYDRYIEYYAQVIYHTDDVMRIKALERAIRHRYSDGGERVSYEAVRKILRADYETQKEFVIEQKLADDTDDLSRERVQQILAEHMEVLDDKIKSNRATKSVERLVLWLQNMYKMRAGKGNELDRTEEYAFGRGGLRRHNRMIRLISTSKVAGSLSSLMKQGLQLVNGEKRFGTPRMARAVWDVLLTRKTRGELFEDQLPLIIGKKGSKTLSETWGNKVMDSIGSPMEFVDAKTSAILARAAYLEAIDQGMNGIDAMAYANDVATEIMGSRQNLERGEIFEAKGLVWKTLTVFAMEAHNSISNLTFDSVADYARIRRNYGNRAAVRFIVGGFIRYFLAAFLINRFFDDELMNQTPVPFDIIGGITEGVAAGQGITARQFWEENIDNVSEWIFGERPYGTEPKEREFDTGAFFETIIEEGADDLTIFSNIVGFLGLFDNSKTILRDPSTSVEKILTDIETVASGDVWENGEGWNAVSNLLSDVVSLTPFAGGQIRKTWQGHHVIRDGGYYFINEDGSRQLAYPVEGGWESLRTLMFGRYGSESAGDYFDLNRKPLSVEDTLRYDELIAMGVGREEAYETILHIKEITKMTESGKQGADLRARREYIANLPWDEKQKLVLYKGVLSESALEKVGYLEEQGVDAGTIMAAYDEYRLIEEEDKKEKIKATDFAFFVDTIADDRDESMMIKETFTYGVLSPVIAEQYEALVDGGLDIDYAYSVAIGVENLTPSDGDKSVSSVLKYQEVVSNGLEEEEARTALLVYATDADKRRMTLSFAEEISAEQFVSVKTSIEYLNDLDGKQTASNAKIEAAISHEDGLNDRQRAILWQLFTSSDSAKNNPFSVSIGWEIAEKIKAYKAAEE